MAVKKRNEVENIALLIVVGVVLIYRQNDVLEDGQDG